MSLAGDVVLGIGAVCSWETATWPVVKDRPDARAVVVGVAEEVARSSRFFFGATATFLLTS
jgi:hypothetical protein